MKQIIGIGNLVDDGTGDYLRKGGIKINDNFTDIYSNLGDGSTVHPAGAWATVSSSSTTALKATFGSAYAIDTSVGMVTVTLPSGTSKDYGKVVRIRDTFASWLKNNVLVKPASGDTIKGSTNTVRFNKQYLDIELVYCKPGRWEYAIGKQVDKISLSDNSSVIKKEFIATEGQYIFDNVFGEDTKYNLNNTEVYHRGNLLFYGEDFSENSDFGSWTNGKLAKLDGKSIALRNKCKANDTVIVVSYLDGLGQFRSTYNRLQMSVLDSSLTEKTSLEGVRFVGDLSTRLTITVEEFGHLTGESVNPNSIEVYVNGVLQSKTDTSDMPIFECVGADGETETDCKLAGGVWTYAPIDYDISVDSSTNSVTAITFGNKLEHGDIVAIKWYNNDIGTTTSMEEIVSHTNNLYIGKGQELDVTGNIRITDYNNPAYPNVEPEEPSTMIINDAQSVFDITYPIGTIYENGLNPNNPSTYMLGQWILYGQKRVLVGWDDGDSEFSYNKNALDGDGNAMRVAGGTGGSDSITLDTSMIPAMETNDKVLVVDANGSVIVGGCQFDPTDEGPAYTKYREDTAKILPTNTPPKSINVRDPYLTVYRWMRIA